MDKTYALVRFEHVSRKLPWWQRMLGRKDAANWLAWRDMRRITLCSVRARDFESAAAKLGGQSLQFAFTPSPFMAENARYRLFKPGKETFRTVARTYDLLGDPADVRDTESFEKHARIFVKIPKTQPFQKLHAVAYEAKASELESDITRALTLSDDSGLFLQELPEIGRTEVRIRTHAPN